MLRAWYSGIFLSNDLLTILAISGVLFHGFSTHILSSQEKKMGIAMDARLLLPHNSGGAIFTLYALAWCTSGVSLWATAPSHALLTPYRNGHCSHGQYVIHYSFCWFIAFTNTYKIIHSSHNLVKLSPTSPSLCSAEKCLW